jgi:hypothetical protein
MQMGSWVHIAVATTISTTHQIAHSESSPPQSTISPSRTPNKQQNLHSPSRTYTRSPLQASPQTAWHRDLRPIIATAIPFLPFLQLLISISIIRIRARTIRHNYNPRLAFSSSRPSQRRLLGITKSRGSGVRVDFACCVARSEYG